MSVFGSYARYYDLLYRDKDYAAETAYVAALLETHAPGRRVLELGCGTGRHACGLAARGFAVTGIDRSATMLDQARRRAGAEPGAPRFASGDIRAFELGAVYDAAIALFHVVSYVTVNEDLAALLGCVRRHLAPGGVFVFDVWYGPAVIALRPEVRVLRLEDESTAITRIAEPAWRPNDNVVEVAYDIQVFDKAAGRRASHTELHRMRYFFLPELAWMLAGAGLRLEHAEEWLSGAEPGTGTWGVCLVAKG